MKPKIICTQCGSVLTLNDKFCPSCGVAVDWENIGTVVEATSQGNGSEKSARKNKSQNKKNFEIISSQSILAAVAVIAIAVIIYLLFIEKKTNADIAQRQTIQPMNAQMQLPAEVQELENSVAANPDDMSLTLQLANQLQDYNRYESAIPYYKAYLKMNPSDANARVDMGICYKELSNFTEAEGAMKMALHYVPNHLNAHFNLGVICLNEGNNEEANKWFKKTVALDPNSEVGKRAQQLLTQQNSQSIQ